MNYTITYWVGKDTSFPYNFQNIKLQIKRVGAKIVGQPKYITI
ncbi:hypothetical protein ACE193_19105 [Bernardetia sp. OM2101]